MLRVLTTGLPGYSLFVLLLLGVCLASRVCRLIIFIKFEKFLAIIFLIFLLPFPSLLGLSLYFIMFHRSWRQSSFFFSLPKNYCQNFDFWYDRRSTNSVLIKLDKTVKNNHFSPLEFKGTQQTEKHLFIKLLNFRQE